LEFNLASLFDQRASSKEHLMTSIVRTRRNVKRAFTLVEILIVVVILGILAAIVIPQFTNASQEAAANSTRSQLQTIRAQVDLYKMKNVGSFPVDSGNLLDLALLVSDGYLQAEPVNSQNNSKVVVAVGGTYTGARWAWDNTLGMTYAINKDGTALESW